MSHTFGYQEVNCWYHVATVASEVFEVTVDHVLRGQRHVDLAFRLDTETVSEDARTGKGPTGAAHCLVQNGRYTLWELLTDVVVIR